MFRAEDKQSGIWTLMQPVSGRIWMGMGVAALGTSAALGAVASLSLIVHVLTTATPIEFAGYRWDIVSLVSVALVLTGLSMILRLIAFLISHFAAYRLEERLRIDLAGKLARMPMGAVIAHGSGALKKILLDDVKGLHVYVADSTPFIGRSVAGPVVTLMLLFPLDWRLALASLGVFLVGMGGLFYVMRDFKAIREAYDQGNENINAAAVEFVQAMPVVRTFDTGTGTFRRYHDMLVNFRDMLAKWIEASSGPGRFSILILGPLPTLVFVSMIGLILYMQGLVSFSVLMAFWLLSTGVAESLMPLMWLMNMNRMAQIGAIRINDFLACPPLPAVTKPQIPGEASIVFDIVDFTYPGRSQKALSGVSFTASPGTVNALVGLSGSGKSTIAKLMARFYDVTNGAIKVGGVDIRHIPTEILMNHVSFVFQDTFLFHETIIENIRIARMTASDAEVKAAARLAMADEFIMQLPEGYETMAGDRGARLSGGQRQRITIARAILRNAPILVLDEATAFADPENEALIVKGLAHLMRRRTVLIIAHRLSTICDADQILVLDQGQIVERGRHENLIRSKGLYRQLWNHQKEAQGWYLRRDQTQAVGRAGGESGLPPEFCKKQTLNQE